VRADEPGYPRNDRAGLVHPVGRAGGQAVSNIGSTPPYRQRAGGLAYSSQAGGGSTRVLDADYPDPAQGHRGPFWKSNDDVMELDKANSSVTGSSALCPLARRRLGQPRLIWESRRAATEGQDGVNSLASTAKDPASFRLEDPAGRNQGLPWDRPQDLECGPATRRPAPVNSSSEAPS
jgi:hypothetical protein